MTDKEKDPEYIYFSGAALADLMGELIAVQGIPGAQLEVHGPLGKHAYLRVVASGYAGEDINSAHNCPGSPGCS